MPVYHLFLFTHFIYVVLLNINMNYISTIDLFKKSWETVKANFVKIVGATVVLLVIQAFLDNVASFDEKVSMTPATGLAAFAATILSLVIGVAITSAIIRIARGEVVRTEVFSVTLSQILRYVGVLAVMMLIFVAFFIILAGVAILLGVSTYVAGDIDASIVGFIITVLLAIIALVYINFRIMFATYLVVDGKIGVFDAIKYSWKITHGNMWTLVKLVILSFGLVLLGILALVVGIFVAIPVIALTYAYVYLELAERKEKVHKVSRKKVVNE